MITLLPDQEELIAKTREALRSSRFVLMQSATGSGKTIMSLSMFRSAQDKGKRCMMVVPRRELLRQTSNTLRDFGIEHGFIASGIPYNPHHLVHVATTETLVRRLETAPDKDLVIFDEVHHGAASLDRIIAHYRDRGAFGVGLSATPSRTDGKGLGCWFQKMVCGKPIRWLIDNGRLSDYRLFAPDRPDFSGEMKGGHYVQSKIEKRMEGDRVLIGSAVDHYRQHAMGLVNVTFCVSRKAGQVTNEAFRAAGVLSAYVDGETPDSEREAIFKALARREIQNVCSVDLLTFGFDLAAAAGMPVTVESLSDLRPTDSLALQMQKYGRALRMKPTPALIFDHANNVTKHGLPCDDREWTLEDDAKGSRKAAEKVLAIRQCPRCDMVHRPSAVCPKCGYEYPVDAREIEQVDGQLVDVTESVLARKKREAEEMKRERASCRTIDDLILFAQRRGYKNPHVWAAKWYSLRGRYRV